MHTVQNIRSDACCMLTSHFRYLFCIKQQKENWVETHQAQHGLVCATITHMHYNTESAKRYVYPFEPLESDFSTHTMGLRVSQSSAYRLYGDRILNLTTILRALYMNFPFHLRAISISA